MMMFVIFLIVNVGTIGIFYGVYGTKRKYEEGMLMGVHLPGSAAESEEVKMLMKKYRTWTKWFYTLNLLAGIAVCGFCFWYISVFMIVWPFTRAERSGSSFTAEFRAVSREAARATVGVPLR